jgi:hypothetical protein
VPIWGGDVSYLSYSAANWDESVCPAPDQVDFDRPRRPHECAGSLLAQMAADLLLRALLTALPGLRLAVPPDLVRWQRRTVLRGPAELPRHLVAAAGPTQLPGDLTACLSPGVVRLGAGAARGAAGSRRARLPPPVAR